MPVEQRRTLVTAVPGPNSLALAARKAASVANGVGTIVPAYVVEASGGILVDADGNRLIDFGSGIAVTTVGNAAPAVVKRVTEAVQRFTHTCFMVNPYEGYVEVASGSPSSPPAPIRRSRRCSTPAPRPSRTRSRSPGSPPGAPPWSASTTPTTAAPT